MYQPKPLYKLLDWIDENKLNWYGLSGNEHPNAISLLENNIDKIKWECLSYNPNAIPLLEKYQYKMNWVVLSGNPNAIHLLEQNQYMIDWFMLSKNPNAIHLLEKNLDKVTNWEFLSGNPNAIPLLEANQDKIVWITFSTNPNAIPLLEKNPDKICWPLLSCNPNAIHLLEANQDKISWWRLTLNPNPKAFQLLEKNLHKLDDEEVNCWHNLSSFPNAIPFLEKNQDKISWCHLSKNPSIFELDYQALNERCLIYKEELMMIALHPKRISAWLDAGFEDF